MRWIREVLGWAHSTDILRCFTILLLRILRGIFMRLLRDYQHHRKVLSPWSGSLSYKTKLLQHNRYYCRYFSIKIWRRVSTQCLDAFRIISTIRPIFPFLNFFRLIIFGLLKKNNRLHFKGWSECFL